MARRLNKSLARLSTVTLTAIQRGTYKAKVKRLHDGGGLAPGPYCLFRYWHDGAERCMGIGSLMAVSAAEARDRAIALRRATRTGGDPLPAQQQEQLRAKALVTTFKSEAEIVIGLIEASKVHATTKSNARRAHDLALVTLGPKGIDQIEVPDVVRIVVPRYQESWDGGHRLRHRQNRQPGGAPPCRRLKFHAPTVLTRLPVRVKQKKRGLEGVGQQRDIGAVIVSLVHIPKLLEGPPTYIQSLSKVTR